MAAGSHGTRAIIAAFFANLGIAVAKFVGFAFTGSASMLAESVHSVADTGNQGLLLLGGRLAKRKPTDEFQFGFGRERYFWSFVVALVLFSLGSLFAIFEGIDKIREPEVIESPVWAFVILSLGILLEGFSFRTAIEESRPLKREGSWWHFIRGSKTPELPVVLLEDFGALIGLGFALIAVTISVVADAPTWDGVGTISIGVLLGIIAVVLAIEMKGLIIGESARPGELNAITAAITAAPSVERLIHLRTQYIGPTDLLVGAKVAFDSALTLPELAAAIDELERRVRAEVPHAHPMYIEPDIFRDESRNQSQSTHR